jgi:NAD(P)H-nitrite reductase large subunit
VALYVSGQLLTEDYYVANKLAKGFLGTANIDSNSRLCMSSAVRARPVTTRGTPDGAGGTARGRVAPEPSICVCMGVGAKAIRAAIAGGCDSVASVGTAAGTNCGSC